MKPASNRLKRRLTLLSVALCLSCVLAWNAPESKRDNHVTSLNYQQKTEKTVVSIGLSSQPTFSVYQLKQPNRIVVEILDCDSGPKLTPVQIRNGIVDSAVLSVSETNDYKSCRVILALAKDSSYEVDSNDETITLSIHGTPTPDAKAQAQAFEEIIKSRDAALESAQERIAREQASLAKAQQENARAIAEAKAREQLALDAAKQSKIEAETAKRNAETRAREAEAKAQLAFEAAKTRVAKAEAERDAKRIQQKQNDKNTDALELSHAQNELARANENLKKLEAAKEAAEKRALLATVELESAKAQTEKAKADAMAAKNNAETRERLALTAAEQSKIEAEMAKKEAEIKAQTAQKQAEIAFTEAQNRVKKAEEERDLALKTASKTKNNDADEFLRIQSELAKAKESMAKLETAKANAEAQAKLASVEAKHAKTEAQKALQDAETRAEIAKNDAKRAKIEAQNTKLNAERAIKDAKASAETAQNDAERAKIEAQKAKNDGAKLAKENISLQKKIEKHERLMAELDKEVRSGGAARRKLKKLEAETELLAKEDQEKAAQNASLIEDLKEQSKAGRMAKFQLDDLRAENLKIKHELEKLEQRETQYAKAPKQAPIDTNIAAATETTTRTQIANAAPLDHKVAASASIQDIEFKKLDDAMQVVFKFSAPPEKIESSSIDKSRSLLRIPNAVLSESHNKKYDTSAFNRGVRFVDSTQKEGAVEIIAQSSMPVIESVEQIGNTVVWNFQRVTSTYGGLNAPIDRRANAMLSTAEPDANELSTNYGKRNTLKNTPLARRKITLDIRDGEINDLLRLLSDEIGVSIVVSPDVKGQVTLSLKSVPLDQALDIILRMNDLGMKYEKNIIWIAKSSTFREEEERALKAAEVRERLEPLEVRLIPVNYAMADQLKENITSLLSGRGSVNIDARTNTLILKDVAANLDAAEILVANLDTQTPQILIEARIVETQANFTKELGVQWGGDGIASAATGNATGIVFPSTIGIAGASTNEINSGTASSPNFAVNLPASVGTGSGGALGMTFGSIGGAINLNIRLSALEEKGYLKIVSAPRIMTLDNVEASIEQGTSIPISVVSAAGVQTVFYDAKLNLQVTPHVTRDGNVYLKINISKNEPDFGNTGASGDPSIIRKEAHTELLIPDGDTTVIGGIYTRNTSQSMSSIPVLGSIPFLGYFFRNTSETDNRTELLIFITPRIINRDASIAASGPGSFIPPEDKNSQN